MTNKDLEKLAEIGEKKFLDALAIHLIDIKQNLRYLKKNPNNFQSKYLMEKIKSYKKLIIHCKNYNLKINGSKSIFNEIVKNEIKPYIKNEIKPYRTKIFIQFSENLNSKIETKIAVKKIINTKYFPSEKTYAQMNSELNIQKYY